MLPTNRSDRIGSRHARRDSRRVALLAPVGAAGKVNRQRRGRGNGAQETRRLFLMVQGAAAANHQVKDLLRFLTCGSVDDGKSTLIGRLLYDCALILDDQLATLERESRRFDTGGQDIDFSLLLDGLEDERQQRITIDVAYRFFATPERAFVVADTPGHEQYTRNMAIGASISELAVILVDARKGVLPQTKRHAFICSLFGVRQIVLAVNKMDLVGFKERCFEDIATRFSAFAAGLGGASIWMIPLAARFGDNVA